MKNLLAALVAAFVIVVAAAYWTTALAACGKASWYGPGFHGRQTACRETFDQHGLTAASNVLPCGARAVVTNQRNGRQVTVRINDTGGFGRYGRIIDVSRGAAERLGMVKAGVVPVCVERVR